VNRHEALKVRARSRWRATRREPSDQRGFGDAFQELIERGECRGRVSPVGVNRDNLAVT
jgi:hypothetical protein